VGSNGIKPLSTFSFSTFLSLTCFSSTKFIHTPESAYSYYRIIQFSKLISNNYVTRDYYLKTIVSIIKFTGETMKIDGQDYICTLLLRRWNCHLRPSLASQKLPLLKLTDILPYYTVQKQNRGSKSGSGK
jgi:hypothetical protein